MDFVVEEGILVGVLVELKDSYIDFVEDKKEDKLVVVVHKVVAGVVVVRMVEEVQVDLVEAEVDHKVEVVLEEQVEAEVVHNYYYMAGEVD